MAKNTTPAKTGGLESWWGDLPTPWRAWEGMTRHPDRFIKLEEFDEDGVHVVRAEMPGIDPDKDVKLTVEHGVLTIRAERREEKKTEERNLYRTEFSYGSFSRTVRLPAGATEADVKANYHDGVLEIRFPIDQDEAEAKTIPVSRG